MGAFAPFYRSLKKRLEFFWGSVYIIANLIVAPLWHIFTC